MQRLCRGFTLLELMVVVVLIGIILTFVVRSVGDGGRRDRIQQEAQRITALVEMVGDEAVLQSSVLGMRFEEQGYQFMRYSEQQWQAVEGDGLLRPRQLDESMSLQLLVEGFQLKLGEAAQPTDKEGVEGASPQVVFLPSGERTAFELALQYEDDESGFLLKMPPLGRVEQSRLEGLR